MRPRIVHISGDFPDPINPDKTPVIRRLVELTSDRFDHQVISINRRNPTAAIFAPRTAPSPACGLAGGPDQGSAPRGRGIFGQSFKFGLALEYTAPGKGMLHKYYLQRLAQYLADYLAQGAAPDLMPDLIIGHKLTIEGIIAAELASHLGIPYAINLQGNTDGKILRLRPDLNPHFADIWHGSSVVFAMAPWTLQLVEQRLGTRSVPGMVLPCPLGEEFRPMQPKIAGPTIFTAFSLDNQRGKNLAQITAAFRQIKGQYSDARLTIAGTGSQRSVQHCQQLIRPLGPACQLAGYLPPQQLRKAMNESAVFLLPSRRESFGLVFIEALFSGLPIIYPAGAAVDGYFDNCSFAIGVDPRSKAQIAQALAYMLENEGQIKRDLAAWLAGDGSARFTRRIIADGFSQGLMAALAQQ